MKKSELNDQFITAVSKGDTKEVLKLLGEGADVNAKNAEGSTALHFASFCGYTNIIQLLIKNGARVNIVNNENETPLHWAAMRGGIEASKLLLKNGARATAKSKMNLTPSEIAYKNYEQANLDKENKTTSTTLKYKPAHYLKLATLLAKQEEKANNILNSFT